MAKQKIVVKLSLKNKSRKAMQIVANFPGVDSLALVNEQQIAVTGEGIDSVKLTKSLRKRVGHTELLSVGPVEEKKASKPTTDPTPARSKETKETVRFEYVYPPCYCGHNVPLQVIHEAPYNPCSIL